MTEAAPSIVRGTLTAYANHGLTLLFVYLGQKGLRAEGVLTPENIAILSGSLVSGGASLAMQIYRKLKARRLVQAAIEAPAGTSLEVVKADAAALPLLVK